jgi:hypothetical protein
MAAASGSSLNFPTKHDPDLDIHREALAVYLRQSGYSADFSFFDLSLPEQHIVIHLARLLKQGATR